MELEVSLLCLEEPSTGTHQEQYQCISRLRILFLKINFNIVFHLRLGPRSGLFPLCFPTKIRYTSLLSSTRAICSTHRSVLLNTGEEIIFKVCGSMNAVFEIRMYSHFASFVLVPLPVATGT